MALLILALTLCISIPADAAEPVRKQVVFLPFRVEAPGSTAHLESGLPNILSSRLATRAEIVAITPGKETEQMARALKSGDSAQLGQLLQQSPADYLVIGSLVPKGQGFELTAFVFGKNQGQAPKKFSQPFSNLDDAMTAVDALAWDISDQVFAKPKPADSPAAPGLAPGLAAFQTSHPERAYREGAFAGKERGLESSGLVEMVATQKGRTLPIELMDFNVADLDGDGTEEIILLTPSELLLYRNLDGQFQKIHSVSLPTHIRYLWASFADLNRNGRQELFISGSNGDLPVSSVMEWDGTKLQTLHQNLPYQFRTEMSGQKTPVLLGQGSHPSAPGTGGIFEFQPDPGKGYAPVTEIALPKGCNLYDFTRADIDGNGSLETIAITRQSKLQVFNAGGSLLWTSDDIYGASRNFLGTLTSNAEASREPIYIRTRLIIRDIDQDGISDILVGRNRVETVPFMPNLRYFEGSSLAALKWQKDGLATLWETKKIPGYTVNYQVLPQGADPKVLQLYFAEGETSYPFQFWTSASSAINLYTLRLKGSGK